MKLEQISIKPKYKIPKLIPKVNYDEMFDRQSSRVRLGIVKSQENR